ncbi:hypothetical protein Rt10032_c05g2451 [Rhodotorula toruloides]|uniref:SCP domain-containing protein n=1 Tax=Rhodotorula toruloides TaxID=5286 RepID=A0A511KG66_RHOTO|nr:hypothetical protein Rt10032_c05g2451 [Rhodotorula toruloides]
MRSFASVLAAALALSPAVSAASESHASCTKSKHIKAFGHNKPHHTVEHHHNNKQTTTSHKPKHTTTTHEPAKTHTEHSKTSKSKEKHKVTATGNQFNVSQKSRVPFRSRSTKTAEPTSSTQAKPTTTKPAPPAATTSTAPSGDSVQAISLQKHNDLRAKHHAPALTWNAALADAAQAWANKCVFQHGGGKALSAGENIAAYSGSKADVAYAISLWSDEEAKYNYAKPGYADATGHFTQMVWKGTTQLGCAQAYCDPLTIPGSNSWSGYFYVCEYAAAGNIVGSDSATTAMYFSANVEAP